MTVVLLVTFTIQGNGRDFAVFVVPKNVRNRGNGRGHAASALTCFSVVVSCIGTAINSHRRAFKWLALASASVNVPVIVGRILTPFWLTRAFVRVRVPEESLRTEVWNLHAFFMFNVVVVVLSKAQFDLNALTEVVVPVVFIFARLGDASAITVVFIPVKFNVIRVVSWYSEDFFICIVD